MAQIPGSSWTEGQYVAQPTHVRPGYAFERPGPLSSLTRVWGACHIAPATRLQAGQPAAQRKR
jgi:hypothetical protein